jgi:site-specific recombinase XerD
MDGKPLPKEMMTWPLWRACMRAGLRRIGWHCLRHTFCSHLAMRGAAPTAIQELAGHECFETTKRYLHLAPVMLRETVRLLEARPAQAAKRTEASE